MAAKSEILDRQPPSAVDVERELLGAVMLSPIELDRIAGIVTAADFYSAQNAKLFGHVLAIHEGGEPFDVRRLIERLRQAGELAAVGGHAYLAELAQAVPYAANAVYYAGIIRSKAESRALIHAAEEMLVSAYNGEKVEDVLAAAEGKLAAIRTGRYATDPVEFSQAVQEALDHVDDVLQRRKQAGILTGLRSFDEQVGGVFAGELCIVAARPSQGKTSLASQWAYHIASRGRRVYFATLEMGRRELAQRQLCAMSGVSSKFIRNGTITQEQAARLASAANKAASTRLVLHDWSEIRAYDIRRAARRAGAEVVFVDYLQLVLPADKTQKRYEQVGELAKALKALARDLNIPVVACAQLNRASEQQATEARPRLSHLRESGDIEQTADVVCLLYRPEDGCTAENKYPGERWAAELVVSKNRNGPITALRLNWDAPRTMFTDYGAADADGYHNDFAEFGR